MIPSLLRRRGPFRVFWAGQTISLVGDEITFVAMPLVAVLVLHAGPAAMGLLVAAAWLPYLLLGIPVGAWVDRRRHKRRVMVAADAARALLLLTVPAAAALHVLTMAHLYVVIFLSGSASVFFRVADQALFVAMVPRERYVEGESLLNGSRAFSFVGGPPIAGFLVQLISGPATLVADALSFIASAASLLAIRPVEPDPEPTSRGHLMSGVRFIFESPVMRANLAATTTINLFNLAFHALFILYVVDYLHVAPGVLGVVLGVGSVGSLAGSAVTGRIGRGIGIGPAFMLGCVLFSAPLVIVPLAAGPIPLVLLLLGLSIFLTGFGVMLLDISAGSITASLVPGRLRSRVSGAYTVVNYGVRPLGSLLGGALGSAIGVRQTLFAVTVLGVAGVLWLLPSPLPRMRELPATAPG